MRPKQVFKQKKSANVAKEGPVSFVVFGINIFFHCIRQCTTECTGTVGTKQNKILCEDLFSFLRTRVINQGFIKAQRFSRISPVVRRDIVEQRVY